MPDSPRNAPPVRIIGSRELHQNLPTILSELEKDEVRYVLTVHGKPRAVLVGPQPYLNVVQGELSASEALVGLQLSALLGRELDADPELLADLERILATGRPRGDSNPEPDGNSGSASQNGDA